MLRSSFSQRLEYSSLFGQYIIVPKKKMGHMPKKGATLETLGKLEYEEMVVLQHPLKGPSTDYEVSTQTIITIPKMEALNTL